MFAQHVGLDTSSMESSSSRIKPTKRRLISKFRKTPAGKIDYLSVQDDGSMRDDESQIDDSEDNDLELSDISNSSDFSSHLLDTSHESATLTLPLAIDPPPKPEISSSQMDCDHL